jgi:transposase
LAVARGRLENQLTDLVFPPKTNAANERLAQHLWTIATTCSRSCVSRGWAPPTGVPSWRSASGVILRKVWGGSRTWVGAQAQSVLMPVWRTCCQQGRCALDFLSQLLRGRPAALALPS